jgi:hypothetical protein
MSTAGVEFLTPVPPDDAVLDLLEQHIVGLEQLGVEPMQAGRALVKGGLAQLRVAAQSEHHEIAELEALIGYLEAKVADLKRLHWS